MAKDFPGGGTIGTATEYRQYQRKELTGERSGGIDKALAILEWKGTMHAALKGAFSKLYAYTSDEEGIRHAMIQDANTTFAEAKFMLVACSAFVNLLIETAGRSSTRS